MNKLLRQEIEAVRRLKKALLQNGWLVMTSYDDMDGYNSDDSDFMKTCRCFFEVFQLCAMKNNHPIRWYRVKVGETDAKSYLNKLRRFEENFGGYASQFILAHYNARNGFKFYYDGNTVPLTNVHLKTQKIQSNEV